MELEVGRRALKGEFLRSAKLVNTMIQQLSVFTSEVTRLAREVGTEGKPGGQAQVPGAGGTWKDLTDNVNFMASNLTEQVRGIVKVVTAVANGNLSQRLTVQAKGEVAALADTINNMTDTLATFADQVTNVAREVGVDGRLGGQANVPGAAGTWKDPTGNVNLLSNAVKFTTQGHVEVRVGFATQGWTPDHPVLSTARQVIAFVVDDTGIDVAPEKQRLIFEAFQQADAGTSRKYGGTALGLAISRELAVLLGGEIRLSSRHGEGSTFTLFLPLLYAGPDSERKARSNNPAGESLRPHALTVLPVARDEHIEDDRNTLEEGAPVLLIIEDDPHYARILLGLARDKGFKGIVASKGSLGLSFARQFHPAAISLDIFLPDMLGWTVLNQLKRDPVTRHIPVQIVTLDEERQHGFAHGAFAYLVKAPTIEGLETAFERMKDFTAPRTKRLLIVEDNDIERSSIIDCWIMKTSSWWL